MHSGRNDSNSSCCFIASFLDLAKHRKKNCLAGEAILRWSQAMATKSVENCSLQAGKPRRRVPYLSPAKTRAGRESVGRRVEWRGRAARPLTRLAPDVSTRSAPPQGKSNRPLGASARGFAPPSSPPAMAARRRPHRDAFCYTHRPASQEGGKKE